MLMLALVMEKPVRDTDEIEYDGGSIQVTPAADLAPGTFAYAPQGNILMSGTFRDAITLADEPAAFDQVNYYTGEIFKECIDNPSGKTN